MLRSGFHYHYFSHNEVYLKFYDEVNDKDYSVCTCPNLSVADMVASELQSAYRKVYVRNGGPRA